MDGNPFRAANLRIAVKARELDVREDVPFICECEERGCFRTVRCALDEYERLLESHDGFLILPGHPHPRAGVDAAA